MDRKVKYTRHRFWDDGIGEVFLYDKKEVVIQLEDFVYKLNLKEQDIIALAEAFNLKVSKK